MRDTWKRDLGDTDSRLIVCVEEVTDAMAGRELEVGRAPTALRLF